MQPGHLGDADILIPALGAAPAAAGEIVCCTLLCIASSDLCASSDCLVCGVCAGMARCWEHPAGAAVAAAAVGHGAGAGSAAGQPAAAQQPQPAPAPTRQRRAGVFSLKSMALQVWDCSFLSKCETMQEFKVFSTSGTGHLVKKNVRCLAKSQQHLAASAVQRTGAVN